MLSLKRLNNSTILCLPRRLRLQGLLNSMLFAPNREHNGNKSWQKLNLCFLTTSLDLRLRGNSSRKSWRRCNRKRLLLRQIEMRWHLGKKKWWEKNRRFWLESKLLWRKLLRSEERNLSNCSGLLYYKRRLIKYRARRLVRKLNWSKLWQLRATRLRSLNLQLSSTKNSWRTTRMQLMIYI